MKDKLFLRAFAERKEGEPGKAGEPITFVASTEGVKRDGKNLDVKRWNLDNYLRNAVFLWAHDYMGRNLPIGRSAVEIRGKQLVAEVTFDQADDFARQVEMKYRNGYLNAVSVGWLDLARCKKCGNLLDAWSYWGMEYLRKKCPHCEAELTGESVDLEYDLLDISGVPVPGDPDALIERQYAALRSIMEYSRDKGEGDWSEAATEMVKLFHMPAPDDTDETRLRKYRALLPKYRRAGKEAPEFRTLEELEALGEEEIRGLFLEGEEEFVDLTPGPFPKGKGRAGAVLSGRNKTDLEQAVTLIQGVLERATKEVDNESVGSGRSVDDELAALQALNIRLALIGGSKRNG
jgi:hypothetical protein